ncbi:MAG: lysophospholipase, partial [Bacteroidota bacterium]
MLESTFSWKTRDQIQIYGKHWKVKNPKAVICLVHGLGEHIHRYDHVAEYFNEKGIAVIGNDRRGHGRSKGKRGHCQQFEDFLMEVKHLLATAKAHYAGLPTFLYGHSMGGNIVLNYLIKERPPLAGAILSGTWIRLGNPPAKWLYQAGKLVVKVAPSIARPNELNPHYISTDPEEVEKYKADNLVHDQITFATGMGMIEAAKRLDYFSGSLSVPILAMHGGGDQIILPSGTEALGKRIKSEIEVKIWEGAYHEIHNEPNRTEVFDYT